MAESNSDMNISGKVALVTGAAGGIGKVLVETLLQKKAKGIGIVDINKDKSQEFIQKLQKTYGDDKVLFIQCDVTNKEQLRTAFEKTKNHFGQLDIVCNNAGIINEFKYEEMVAINLTSVITGTYLAVEFMGTQNGGNGGVVINSASRSGIISWPWIPVYVATKHGVVGFTRSVAKEPMVKDNGVRVSTLCPESVDTEFIASIGKGVRYKDFAEVEMNSGKLKPTQVADAAVKLIENGCYNGCACLVTRDVPFEIVHEQKI